MEKVEFLEKAYEALFKNGICHSKKEFADMLGVSRTNMYRNASQLTIMKAEKILQSRGITIDGEQNGIVQNGIENNATQENNIAPLVAEMAAQREMYDKHLSEALRIISKLTEKNG